MAFGGVIDSTMAAGTIVATAKQLGITLPKPVTAAHARAQKIRQRSGELAPPGDARVTAVLAALDDDRDPATDPDVQRIVTAGAIANDGVTRGLRERAGDDLRAVLADHADPLVGLLREPFDRAVADIELAHERIGDLPLDATNDIMRKGDDIAAVWACATDATRTIESCATVWASLAQVTRFAPYDINHRVLVVADATPQQWTEHRLHGRKMSAWDARRAGLRLDLADANEYRRRVQAIDKALAPGPTVKAS